MSIYSNRFSMGQMIITIALAALCVACIVIVAKDIKAIAKEM